MKGLSCSGSSIKGPRFPSFPWIEEQSFLLFVLLLLLRFEDGIPSQTITTSIIETIAAAGSSPHLVSAFLEEERTLRHRGFESRHCLPPPPPPSNNYVSALV